MTYQSDPTRWTQSPGEAPELLRSGLEAASREGPSDLQMRALALKLAAVGGGAALAATAVGAKASTTAAGTGVAAAGGSAFSLTKIAVTVALIGAAATGGTMMVRQPAPTLIPQVAVEQAGPKRAQQLQPTQPSVESAGAQVEAAEPTQPTRAARGTRHAAPALEAQAASRTSSQREQADVATAPKPARSERGEARPERMQAAAPTSPAERAPAKSSYTVPSVEQVRGEKPQLSEIDLLRKARIALAARPREAYELTEEHRERFPQGMFAQERDALAVEALLRAGDLDHARERAETFVRRYPSSPHAHRFRETMQIP